MVWVDVLNVSSMMFLHQNCDDVPQHFPQEEPLLCQPRSGSAEPPSLNVLQLHSHSASHTHLQLLEKRERETVPMDREEKENTLIC